jgi:hypothetical protein
MANILVTEKQMKVITNKVLSEKESTKETINESLLSFENILMAAGFIPVIGEVADIALIMYYLYKGEKLYAALMLIALIPTVGDFIAKPIIRLFKGSREGVIAMKEGGAKLTQYLAKNPEMAAKFSSLGKYTKSPAVEKTVQNITKVNSNLGSTLKKGLDELSGGGALAGLKAGGKEVLAGGSFKTGLKDYFQGQRLSKYFAKNGVLPEAGIKKWWLNVRAGQDRRNAFRRFIRTNNLLDYFGIPSLTTFETKLSDDAEFRKKVAEDPKMSDYIAQNYNSEDNVQGTQPQSNNTTNTSSSIGNVDPIQNLFSTLFGGQMKTAGMLGI